MTTILSLFNAELAGKIEGILREANIAASVIDSKMYWSGSLIGSRAPNYNVIVPEEDADRARTIILSHFPELQIPASEVGVANAIASMRIPIAITALLVVGMLALYFSGVIQ